MGILLVTDILDEHRSLTDLFGGNGDPLTLGWIGWWVILLCTLFVGYHPVKYIRKYIEIKRTKAACVSKKEKNRVELDSENLDYKKSVGAYEKKKRRWEREIEKKSKQIEEIKKKQFIDFKFFYNKGRKVIKELETDIKDLEDKLNKVEKKMEKRADRHLASCEKLQNEVVDCEKKLENADYELEKSKTVLKENMKKKRTACVLFLLVLLTDRSNMIASAQELIKTLAGAFASSEGSQVNESETATPEDVTMDNEDEKNEILSDIENDLREDMNYNFILEYEQLHKAIDGEIEDIISLKDYSKDMKGYKKFLIDCREGKIIEILPDVNYEMEFNLDELLNEIAEDLEKPFLRKISEGKMIQTQIEWEQSAPKSMELEKIIDKRRLVLGMEESISIRRTIYYRLANDYQRLGNECLIQGKDGTQIYYYYGMSIYCCYCALRYEERGEKSYSDKEILNYVKARYKDIMDNENMGIPKKKVNIAKKIYFLLDNSEINKKYEEERALKNPRVAII